MFGNFFKKNAENKIPEIGKDIPWNVIANHVFRILDFDRTGTIIKNNGKVKAKSLFKPYGYLIVESPILNNPLEILSISFSSIFTNPPKKSYITKQCFKI